MFGDAEAVQQVINRGCKLLDQGEFRRLNFLSGIFINDTLQDVVWQISVDNVEREESGNK